MGQVELHCISGNNDSYRDRFLSMEKACSMSEDCWLALESNHVEVEAITFPLLVCTNTDRNLEVEEQEQTTCRRPFIDCVMSNNTFRLR